MELQTVDDLLKRARSQVGLGIRYKLGSGAMTAAPHTCEGADGSCDCSSFVCWALGIDKHGSYPYLVEGGKPIAPGDQWYSTDNIVNDAVHISVGLFQKIKAPVVGTVIVFPTRWKGGKPSPPGHVGIVTAVGAADAFSIVHCSAGNYKKAQDAIQETDDAAFRNAPGLIYSWSSRIALPAVVARKATTLRTGATAFDFASPVRFCIVATGADGASIEKVATAVAALNPFGRKTVVSNDPDYPDAADITTWTQNTPNPGAVVLTPDGSLSEVLTVIQAKSDLAVDQAFANAAA